MIDCDGVNDSAGTAGTATGHRDALGEGQQHDSGARTASSSQRRSIDGRLTSGRLPSGIFGGRHRLAAQPSTAQTLAHAGAAVGTSSWGWRTWLHARPLIWSTQTLAWSGWNR